MRLRPLRFALIALLLAAGPARAIDPPYQAEMERLSEILGSLYFLDPLCKPNAGSDWRGEMADLIALDEPDDDRKQRLAGAFNSGYEAYARLYRVCTVSAEQAMSRLLIEAEKTARDIHSRYAE
ncbi:MULTISPECIES: TIGR02301 family protein [unclassified Devosia]|uniref:TIGR02301 family protein n=1 Tax=unclassified Devosia TaxID=196773 RepID=UPI000968B538|nr:MULTISPECIES: TIGR02301 family protein [unclassified Devosia]MBN9362454.1 TIGR02301 family protein [Devosia sp.]OJX24318.1 MAG: TIGR02301 family protein [Devosia sp. 66-14]